MRVDPGPGPLATLPERLLGHTRWQLASGPLGDGVAAAARRAGAADWSAHRRAFAERHPIAELVWVLPGADGPLPVCESGAPRFSAAGEFLGYAGVIREAGAALARERQAIGLAQAVHGLAVPLLGVEADANGCVRVRTANAAASALLGADGADLPGRPLDQLPLDGGTGAARSLAVVVGEALASGRALVRTARLVEHDGRTRPLTLRLDSLPPLDGRSAVGVLTLDPLPHEVRARQDALAAAER